MRAYPAFEGGRGWPHCGGTRSSSDRGVARAKSGRRGLFMTVDAEYAFDPSDPTTAKNPEIHGKDPARTRRGAAE